MEKISHRITLDVHKGGIQKVLHGMFTGDVLSRKIVISLVAGSAVCNMDENTAAVMYVTKPSGVTNYGACTVEGNLVTYDILPADIDEPGITQMQLKVISGEMVLYAPMFSVEAQRNSTSDTPAETSPQFSALEQALAQVEEVYNERIVSVEVEEDYTFVVTYADGETYTSEAFKELMEDIEKAEHERAEAEVARDVAEENRKLAESARASSYADMKNDIQGAIDANTALYNRVEDLADEGLITESRVIEIIEEQGGGGGGGTVVLPDNVLVASDVSAAEVNPPKINADLFGSLLPSDYAKTSDVNAIKNGTTQVGNAKTLDGHGAEYFAPKTDLANYLPLTGGGTIKTTFWNNVNIKRDTEDTTDQWASMVFSDNNTILGGIGYSGINNLCKIDANGGAVRTILHTGNKPTGTYTGNGVDALRSIAVGGLANGVIVYGPGRMAVVTFGGYVGHQSGNVKAHTTTYFDEPNKALCVGSNDVNFLNENGVQYKYFAF